MFISDIREIRGSISLKENFKRALAFTLSHECVFTAGHDGDMAHVVAENVSGDRGGLTKFGIDQRSHPHVNIRALDYNQAREIYLVEYWTKCRCDDLPGGYDTAIFDTAVNCGCGTAILLLQRALNNAGVYPPLKEDAFIGPKTISASHRGRREGLDRFLIERANRYEQIAHDNPSQKKFLRGWLNRNVALAAELNLTSKPEVVTA